MVQSKVWNRPGIGNVGSYQAAGTPFLTGSSLPAASFATNNGEVKVEFPRVAKSLTVISRAPANLRVHFNSVTAGNVISGSHFVTLSDSKDSVSFAVRCKEVYITLEDGVSGDGEFELIAELTHIPAGEMYALTGSGLTD